MADDKEILFKIEIPSEGETARTLESLTKASKELREERKKLNLDTAEGQKRVQEINKQLDQNNALIKENSSALEKQRLNVGNYTGALDKLVPGLGATANGFGAMTKQAWAFVANPIGAVIAALGLAISALTAYFKGSEEGQNNFNKVLKVGSVIMGNLLDIVRDFGGAIFKVFTGDFKGAVDSIKEGFSSIANVVAETNEEIAKGLDIENARARGDLLQRELIVLKAKNEAEIASLKLRSEDKSIDVKDRVKALQEAQRLQNDLSDKEVELATIRLNIRTRENALSDSTKDDLNEEAELKARLFQIEKDRDDKSKEIFTKTQALNEEIKKQNEALKESIALQEHIKEVQELKFEQDEKATEINLVQIDSIKNLGKVQFDSSALIIKSNKEVDESKRRQAELHTILEQEKLAATSNALGQASTLFNQNTAAYKLTASAKAVIDTYSAADFALSTYPPPLGAIFAAINIALGLANVARINAVTFARGGLLAQNGMILNGPSHSQGGIPFSVGGRLGFEAEGGEAIINKRSTAMFRRQLSEINQAGGGVAFAAGGTLPTSFAQSTGRQSEASAINRDLISAIAGIRPVVSVEDINTSQRRVEIIETTAQVI